jgi:hypothetical protein
MSNSQPHQQTDRIATSDAASQAVFMPRSGGAAAASRHGDQSLLSHRIQTAPRRSGCADHLGRAHAPPHALRESTAPRHASRGGALKFKPDDG